MPTWRVRLPAVVCALASIAGLSGCRHKPVRPVLPIGVLAPVELETPLRDVNSSGEIAAEPEPEFGPLPAAEPPPPPRRRPAPSTREPEPAQPTQVAGNDATAALAIGALSAGGEDVTHTAQEAQDLINAVLKRVAALSTQVLSTQKREVREVHAFLDQAQKALKSGDAEGAHTLATRASLLMDEVEKK